MELAIYNCKVCWRCRYIFKHWTSRSSLCAQQVSIWAPSVARHWSRWYSVFARISLLTHSATVTFCTFSRLK